MNVVLRSQSDDLLAKIGALEDYYKKYAKIHPILFREVKLHELEEFKLTLQGKYKREIDALPDILPELASNVTPAQAAEIEDIRVKFAVITRVFERYNNIYKRLADRIGIIVRESDKRFLLSQKKYNSLVREAEAIAAPIYDAKYRKDTKFEKRLRLLNEHVAKYAGLLKTVNNAVRSASNQVKPDDPYNITDKERAYNNGVAALELHAEMYRVLRKAFEGRIEVLKADEEAYNQALIEKYKFIYKTEGLRSLSKKTLDAMSVYDDSIEAKILEFKRQMTEFDKDGAAETSLTHGTAAEHFLAKGHTHEEMRAKTSGLSEDITAYELVHDSYTTQIFALFARVESDISANQQSFLTLYDHIYHQLEQHYLDKTAIKIIKEEFEAIVSESDEKHVDSFTFLHHKNSKLNAVLEKLTQQGQVEQKIIDDKLQERLNHLKDIIITQRKTALHGVRVNAFRFDEKEELLYNKVVNVPYARNKFPKDVTYEALLDQQSNLQIVTESLQKVIALHRKAKQIFINFELVVNDINHSEQGPVILATFARYFSEWSQEHRIDLFSKLGSNLHLFNRQGLNAIQAFVDSQPKEEVADIKNKLNFVNLLADHGIPSHSFLSKPDVVTTALQLKEWGLDYLLSTKHLNNTNFCKAISLFKRYDLAILFNNNPKMIKKAVAMLLNDANKCEIICQQEELYKKATGPSQIKEEIFKELMKDFIMADASVARAVNLVRKHAPKYCGHWLLVMVKENATLRDILSNEYNLKRNMPFLVPLLERSLGAPYLNFNFLKYYLSRTPKIKQIGQADFQSYMADYQEALTAIRHANKDAASHSFHKMSVFMNKFNEFMANYQTELDDQEAKAEVKDFHRKMIPTLLTTEDLDRKKSDLEDLARSHFKDKDYILKVILDLMQILFVGLPIVVRVICGYAPFFSWEKTATHKAVDQGTAEAFEASDDPLVSIKSEDNVSESESDPENPPDVSPAFGV